MDFSAFLDQLQQQLKLPLPGTAAHEDLRALAVGNNLPRFDHKVPPRPGSVLILLYNDGGRIKFPLIKRAEYLGAHSGQISLPGGKAEPGEDVFQTALRECEEEIGVPQTNVTILGTLSEFFVMPSNFMVTPVIAVTEKTAFHPDPREVVRVLSADILDILADETIKKKEIQAAGKYTLMAPHFEIEGEVVWGATAMMLNEFRYVLRKAMGGLSTGNQYPR